MSKNLLLGLLFCVGCTLAYGQSEKEEAWEKFFNPKNICSILGVSTKSDLEKEYGEVTLSKYSPQNYNQLYWGALFKGNTIDVTLLLWKSTNIVAHAEVKGMSPEKYLECVKKFRAYGFKDVKSPHSPLEMEKNGIKFTGVPFNDNSYWIECWSVEKMKNSNAVEGGFDLFSANMQQYLGKVNREQFEKIVGEPVGYEDGGVIVYNVINGYTQDETGIRCFYREKDGLLISVRFPTKYYLGYWIDFMHQKNYPKTEAEAKRLGMFKTYEDRYNQTYKMDFKLGAFGMQIMNINDRDGTCTINYHIL